MDNDIKAHLKENGIMVEDYEKVIDYVKGIEKKSKVFIDPARINRWIYKGIPESCKIIEGINITTELKAIKIM